MKKLLQLMALAVAMAVSAGAQAQLQKLENYQLSVDTTTFTSIVGTGTPMYFADADDGYCLVTLPFSLPYGESTVAAGSTIACSANGYMYLGANSMSGSSCCYSCNNIRAVHALINNNTTIGRYVGVSGTYWKYDASSPVRSLTIEYHGLTTVASPYGFYSFQVVFYENGNIAFVYDSVNRGHGATNRQFAAYLTDGPNNDRIFLQGDWANPTTTPYSFILNSTTLPAHGLRYTFIRPVVSCPRPTLLDARDVNDDSMTVYWARGGTESAWELVFDGVAYHTTDTFHTFHNLPHNTPYFTSVRAICGAGDSSTWRSNYLHSACGLIDSLPYVQDFEAEEDATLDALSHPFVKCLTRLNNGSLYYSVTPYVRNFGNSSHSGSKILYWDHLVGEDCGDYQYVVLPGVDTSLFPMDTMKLSFWIRTYGGDHPQLQVGVMSNPNNINTFQQVAAVNVFPNNGWQEISTHFRNYTGGGQYIAIRAQGGSSWTADIDDISIDLIPSCPTIHSHQVVTTASAAIVSWAIDPAFNYYPGSFDVSYGYASSPGNDTTLSLTNSNLVLTGLDADTTYTMTISTNCNGLLGQPYTFNFSTQTLPCANWDQLGDCMSQYDCFPPYVTVEQENRYTLGVSWLPGYHEVSWDLEYRIADSPTWIIELYNTPLTHHTFSLNNLLPATQYEFRVTAHCVDTNLSHTVTYNTPCGINVPFSESFESFSTSASDPLPNCWSRHYNSTNDILYASTAQSHSGTNALYLNSIASNYCYLVLPQFNIPIDSTQVAFWLYSTYFTDSLKVGVMTNPDDYTTFVPVGSVASSALSVWEPFEVDMSPYLDNGCYLAIMSPFGSHNVLYLDDLVVTRLNPCSRVTSVAATDITHNSATITWDAIDANNYEVEYGPAGFTVGTGTTISVLDTTSVTITNLTPNTEYDVYVRYFCSSGSSEWSFIYTFHTHCTPIDSLPFIEDFESYPIGSSDTDSPFIPCWGHLNNAINYGGYPYVFPTDVNHTPGGNKLLNWRGPSSTNYYGDYQYIVLPKLDTLSLPINTLQLSLWIRASTDQNPVFQIGVMNSNTDTAFSHVATINVTGNYEWNEYTASFSTYHGNGEYIAIRSIGAPLNWSAFIDDITLDIQPTCPRVENLTVSNVQHNCASLTWSDTSSTNTLWLIEYDTVDFTPGTGHMTPIAVSDTAYFLAGLNTGTLYYVYVYPYCGDNTFARHLTFTTLSIAPTTLPYSCDFESNGNNGWDLDNDGQTNNWAVGNQTGNLGRSMYISNDNGHSYMYDLLLRSNVYASKPFILDSAGNYIISYDWRANGENNRDFMRVFLIPSNGRVLSSYDIAYSIPSNWITLDSGSQLNMNNIWRNHMEVFPVTTPGVYNLVFYWQNDRHLGENPPAAVDNVQLYRYTCPIPQNIVFDTITGTEATFHWAPAGGESQWILTVNDSTYLTGTPQLSVNGLTPYTYYTVSLRSICGAGDTSMAAMATFLTSNCPDIIIIDNGDPESDSTSYTTLNAPVNNLYNYSLSETIIDSTEIGTSIILSGIAYYYDYNRPTTEKNNVDIWLKPTTKTAFNSSSDIEPLDANAVKVYSGPLNCSRGWNCFVFNTDYYYNGVGNLMVIVDDNSGGHNGSHYRFKTLASLEHKTLTYYSNTINPDVSNLGSSYNGSKSYYLWRPAMQLISCDSTVCLPPRNITVSNVTYSSATLKWRGSHTDYMVAVKTASEGIWPAGTMVHGTGPFVINRLHPATSYMFRIRSVCDSAEGFTSLWREGTFVTDSFFCIPPTVLEATPDYTSVTIDWRPAFNENLWNVRVWNSSKDSIITVDSYPLLVGGLAQNTEYNVAIQTYFEELCESEFSDTIQFTTLTCQPPTGVAVSNVTDTTATVTWSGDAESYDISYGERGFGEGQGEIVQGVTGNSYILTGLESDMLYDVYVRAICQPGVTSGWSDRVGFSAAIHQVDRGMAVSIHPNPTTGATTISLSGVSGEVAIAVIDLSGRTVKSCSVVCNGDCAKTVTVDDLAAGAYFVRITANGTNTVKKLVVK